MLRSILVILLGGVGLANYLAYLLGAQADPVVTFLAFVAAYVVVRESGE